MGCQEVPRPRASEGVRCRPGSLALRIGQLPVARTSWVAVGVVSSVDPILSTVKQGCSRRPVDRVERSGWTLHGPCNKVKHKSRRGTKTGELGDRREGRRGSRGRDRREGGIRDGTGRDGKGREGKGGEAKGGKREERR